MSPDPTPDTANRPGADSPEPRRKLADYAPKVAALAVAGVAVTAAFIGARQEPAAEQSAASAPPPRLAVVRAPPLIVAAPPLHERAPPAARGATRAMGAAPACDRCGVVESVEAATPGQSFQMRIRMDDGSTRTLEQRGALAAGTRVVVDGGSVRLLPG